MPSWRCSCTAEIPGWCVATRYAAQNHRRSGICVLCITVPAVTEVCAPQLLHCHTRRAWCIAPTSPPPHRRQQKPSGQRQANRYSRHACSEAKRSWNSMIVKGNPGLGTQSTYDQAQTEKIGYANHDKATILEGAFSVAESPVRPPEALL